MHRFASEQLRQADLVVDAVYEGGRAGNAGDDPLPRLLGVSNQGGFRYLGTAESPSLVVLTSSFADPEWPDEIDLQTGLLTYYGDNKRPGRTLHETPRFGNLLLRRFFEAIHSQPPNREWVPPILLFARAGTFRDLVFRGLAVPGAPAVGPTNDLVAIWRATSGQRFQNYRATFSVLDVATIPRGWIEDIKAGTPLSKRCPGPWREWRVSGTPKLLVARPSVEYRTKEEQLPADLVSRDLLEAINSYFNERPVGFEQCATELARLLDTGFFSFDLTRPSRDGGRDAIGLYRVGSAQSSLFVECALEAKCYAESVGVGVREVARLISRIRHRQFGILVTTSYVSLQAYRELTEDGHPVIVIAGRDIAEILTRNGLGSRAAVDDWLRARFPNNGVSDAQGS